MADLRILGLGAEVELGESLRLDTNLAGPGPDVRFQWDFGDGSVSDAAKPEKRYAQAGAYDVSLTVSNAAGESRTARAQVVTGRFSLVDGMVCDGATPRSGWCHVNSAPLLRRLGFFDENMLWAWTRSAVRGEESTMRSTDGGRTWTAALPIPFRAVDVFAVSPGLGISISESSEVWVTRDAGRSWNRMGMAYGPGRSGQVPLVRAQQESMRIGPLRIVSASLDGTQLRLSLGDQSPFTSPTPEQLWSRDGGLNWSYAPSLSVELTPDGTWFYLQGDRIVRERGQERIERALSGLSPSGTVAFSSNLDGWVIDGTAVWQTHDGGNTWSYDSPRGIPVAGGTNGLRAVGEQVLWLTGHQVLRSGDAGKTWRPVVPPGEIEATPLFRRPYHDASSRVQPLTSDGGYAVRGTHDQALCRSVVFTTDGGATWTDYSLPASIAGCIASIHATRQQGITMVNDRYALSDQGTTVKQIFGHHPMELTISTEDLAFRDARQWVGKRTMTRDGGRSWQSHDWAFPGGGSELLSALRVGSGNLAWASFHQSGDIARTTDGGNSWATVGLSGPDDFKPTSVRDLQFLDDQTGWATAGEGSGLFRHGLWRTLDGGQRWSYRGPAPIGTLAFTTARTGVMVAHDGTVHLTDDGGLSWRVSPTKPTIPADSRVEKVYFRNSQLGFLLVDKGGQPLLPRETQGLWRTTDGGLTWQEIGLPMGDLPAERRLFVSFRGIHFGSDRVGWIVGSGGVLLHSRDGGATWQRHGTQIDPGLNLSNVHTVDERTAIVVSSDGRSLTTVTGGQ